MTKSKRAFYLSGREFLFQLTLHIIVLVFYALDSEHPVYHYKIEFYKIVFFLHYALANALISYVLLPRFLYKKKYLPFVGFILLVILWVIGVEELILEQIFFTDSRGASFPGILFTLGQILPIIAILSGFKFGWDAFAKQRQVEVLKNKVTESELEFLKSQINPHFLFNNLNKQYAHAIENSPKTPAIILELSAVLRYMLYECKEPSVSLNKEIEHLKNFTRLYELQIEQRGSISFEALHIRSGYKIAPLILITFIENAFKHSQSGQSSGILIRIFIELSEDGTLLFCCKNNFVPVESIDMTAKGIGLQNVQKRLELLYPGDHQLSITQNEREYEVRLSLKLKKDK